MTTTEKLGTILGLINIVPPSDCRQSWNEFIVKTVENIVTDKPFLNSSLDVSEAELVVANKVGKVDAIRCYKHRTGATLLDAKNAIERAMGL